MTLTSEPVWRGQHRANCQADVRTIQVGADAAHQIGHNLFSDGRTLSPGNGLPIARVERPRAVGRGQDTFVGGDVDQVLTHRL